MLLLQNSVTRNWSKTIGSAAATATTNATTPTNATARHDVPNADPTAAPAANVH